jgi:hypothetical protein
VACRDRGGLALCRSRFVRTTWGFPGLRALRPTCAERRDRSRTSTRCFARASRRTVATALPSGPSPLLRDQSDQTVGIHAYPRPSACAGSFPALALCRSLFVRTTVAGGGCVPCSPHVCGASRSQQDEHALCRPRVATALPSPLLRDGTVGIHAYPRRRGLRPAAPCAEGRKAARAGRRPRVGVDAYRLIPQQRAGSAVATRGRHSARAHRSLVLQRSSAHIWAARHAS